MSAHLNEVRLIGRLTRDPDLRTTSTGQAVASFGLATSRKYKGSDGMFKEETTFVDITCWSRLAEIVHNNLRKGRQVFVGGRLRFESWDDRETGKRRSKLTVVADNVQFLDPKDQSGGGPASYSGGPGQQKSQSQDDWSPPGDDYPAESMPDWNEPPMDEPPF